MSQVDDILAQVEKAAKAFNRLGYGENQRFGDYAVTLENACFAIKEAETVGFPLASNIPDEVK